MTVIRQATLSDLATIQQIVATVVDHLLQHDIQQWDEIYPDKETLTADITKQDMSIIEYQGKIAGSITVNTEQPVEYSTVPWKYSGIALVVHRLLIDPSFQGKKFATRLMEHTEKIAIKGKYDSIRLDAFAQNPIALSLYEKLGYKQAGMVTFRKGNFFCYEKALDSAAGIRNK